MTAMARHDVALVGAGPIGLEMAIALKEAGVDYVHLEAGQVGETIWWYPKQVQFFSSPDRIAIGGVGLHTPDQTKATREQYLAYLRGVVQQFDLAIRTFHRVTAIQYGRPADASGDHGDGGAPRFTLRATHFDQQRIFGVDRVILAMGDMHRPRKLNIPGEDMPHVSHYFDDPHRYFRQRLLIVGGRNSAAEAAVRCHRAGARVTVSYRRAAFDDSVKYWIKPELEWLIKTGVITFHPLTTPVRIDRGKVVLGAQQPPEVFPGANQSDLMPTDAPSAAAQAVTRREVAADFVLLLTGYEMDATLFEMAGVELVGKNRAPKFDPMTMQTNVPGLYVAGTAAAGTQNRFKLFIENCHPHVVRILRDIAGVDPTHINDLAYRRLHETALAAES